MLVWGVFGEALAEHGSALQVKRLPGFAPSLCRRQGEGWGGVALRELMQLWLRGLRRSYKCIVCLALNA